VDVVEHDERPGLAAQVGQELGHGVEDEVALGARLERRRLVEVGHALAQRRDKAGDQGRRKPAQLVLGRVSDVVAQELGDRLVGDHRLLVAAPVQHADPTRERLGGELRGQARLAHARLAPERDDRLLAFKAARERGAQERELLFAADERAAGVKAGGQRKRGRLRGWGALRTSHGRLLPQLVGQLARRLRGARLSSLRKRSPNRS
jgi:hypothetical protein